MVKQSFRPFLSFVEPMQIADVGKGTDSSNLSFFQTGSRMADSTHKLVRHLTRVGDAGRVLFR